MTQPMKIEKMIPVTSHASVTVEDLTAGRDDSPINEYPMPPELEPLQDVQLADKKDNTTSSNTTTNSKRPRGRPTIAELEERQRELEAKEASLNEWKAQREAELRAFREEMLRENQVRIEAEIKKAKDEYQSRPQEPEPEPEEKVDPTLLDDVMQDRLDIYHEIWNELDNARDHLQQLRDRTNLFEYPHEFGEKDCEKPFNTTEKLHSISTGKTLKDFIDLRNRFANLPLIISDIQNRLMMLVERNHWDRVSIRYVDNRAEYKEQKKRARDVRAEASKINAQAELKRLKAKLGMQ